MNGSTNHEETLFEQALRLQTPAEQESYVRESCANDAHMRDRLLDLLRAHDRAGMFLEPQDTNPSSKALRPRVGADVRTILLQIPPEGLGTVIGRYKLLQEIGEGGMGVVYMAEQEEPVRRRVALKVIKLGMDTKSVIARFEAERQALAMMDHPNIARVLDGGATETGRPYFVMELVRGIKITEYCDEAKLSTRDRLDLFIKVCQAIQHAHQKGIIHRDIKPSNILVTLHDGVPVPKVIDFGIAKATTGQPLTDKTLFTALDQFIGTPAYMSPEQAELSGLDIDTRCDIYSLGVLLYEILTGKTPFDAQELMASGIDAMRRTIREREPVRPSTRLSTMLEGELTATAKYRRSEAIKLIYLLRGDVDWIVMKCLEKDRSRRYETANGLAMDIQRHLANEPVSARPPTTAYRFQKAWRRNKLLFNAGAAVVTSLILGLGATSWLFIKEARSYRAARAAEVEQIKLRKVAVEALDSENQQRIRAEAQELIARQRAYFSDMNVAKRALDENNMGRAFDLLDRQRPAPGQKDVRGWEWRYLWQQSRSDALFTLVRENSEINSLAVPPDGKMLAVTVRGKGGVSLWDVPARRDLTRLAVAERDIRAVFSPAAPLLAFVGTSANIEQRSTLHLWNTATQEMIAERPLHGGCVGMFISRDGLTLVTATVDGHITLWHLPDGTQLASYPFDPSDTSGTSFATTPELDLAAYASAAKQIHIIDLRTGREHPIKIDYTGDVNALAFSPDGKMLATSGGYQEADIRLWDLAAGREIGRLKGHSSWVSSLVFWPDGKKLASASADQTIRLWDVGRRSCVDTLYGHRQEVWRLALMPDNQTLVSGSKDGAVCFWDCSTVHPRRSRIEFPEPLSAWRFASDGQSILTLSKQGRVARSKGPDFQQLETLMDVGPEEASSRGVCSLSPDGRRLATASSNGLIQVWDIPQRTVWRQWTNATGSAAAFKFLRNGSRLLTYSEADNVFHEWNLDTTSEMQSWQAPQGLSAGGISPDERDFLAIGSSGDTELRNLSEASSSKPAVELRECNDLSYSPDGRLVAASSYLGFARIWNTSTWREVVTLGGFLNGASATTFSPDGTRLVVAGSGRDGVRIWDTENWVETFTLAGEGVDAFFSPDGSTIGLLTSSGSLQLWRAPSWGEISESEAKAEVFIRK